jgi:hypothetical protein
VQLLYIKPSTFACPNNSSKTVRTAEETEKPSESVVQLQKTHGAMIRFGNAEDKYLKAILAVLSDKIENIEH